MTSRCAEPDRSEDRYRTSPRLLSRRLPHGSVVCVAGESVYQDVRVLRLDAVATAVVDHARSARSLADLAAFAGAVEGVPVDSIDELVDGLTAARVLDRAGA